MVDAPDSSTIRHGAGTGQSGTACCVLGDWGTSRLRLYLTAGSILVDQVVGPGIGALTAPPGATLRAALAPWLARHDIRRVVLCGMAGSRTGLAEVPYLPVPATQGEWAQRLMPSTLDGLDVSIAPGLCRVDACGTPDVMRGEETQIFGALQTEPSLADGRHRLLLPGTHSKWVAVDAGRITGFTTHMTGELFALLRDHSTLLRTSAVIEPDAAGFADGVARSRGSAPFLTAALFEARSAQLIQERSAGWAREFLSGLLIGSEIRASLAGPAVGSVTLIGDPRLTALYRRALTDYEIESHELDGDRCVIAGLQLLTHGIDQDTHAH